MSKLSQKLLFRKKRENSEGKTAYLTVGRWQPPHKGHAVLIEKTLQLAQENDGHAYVFISSKEPSMEDKWLKDVSKKDFIKIRQEYKIQNPLSRTDRLYYLQKMFPPNKGFSPDIFDFLLGEHQFKKLTKKDVRGTLVSPRRHGSFSTDLVEYLKKLKYSEVKLIVGSDRIEAFKKYNPDIEIIQAGEDRGGVGEKKLEENMNVGKYGDVGEKQLEQLEKKDMNVGKYGDVEIISYKMKKKNNNFNAKALRRLEKRIQEEEKKEEKYGDEKEDPQPRDAVEFSGSRMREYARQGNTRKFVEGSAIGDMTYKDCLNLMQDVREGMHLELELGPQTKHHIYISPSEYNMGKLTKNSQAHRDTEFFRDRSKFIIQGGSKRTFRKRTFRKRTFNKRTFNKRTFNKRTFKKSSQKSKKSKTSKKSKKRSRKSLFKKKRRKLNKRSQKTRKKQ